MKNEEKKAFQKTLIRAVLPLSLVGLLPFINFDSDFFSTISKTLVFGCSYGALIVGGLLFMLAPLWSCSRKNKNKASKIGITLMTGTLVFSFGTLPPVRAQGGSVTTETVEIPIVNAGESGTQNPFGLPDGVYAGCIPVKYYQDPEDPWDHTGAVGSPAVLTFSTGTSPRVNLVNPRDLNLIEVDDFLERYGLSTNWFDPSILGGSYSINSNAVLSLPFSVSFNTNTGVLKIGDGTSNVLSTVQASTNLVDWKPIGPAMSLPQGLNVRMTDNVSPTLDSVSSIYYRLAIQPDLDSVVGTYPAIGSDVGIQAVALPLWACILIVVFVLIIIGGLAYLIYKLIKKCKALIDKYNKQTDEPPKGITRLVQTRQMFV